MLLLYHKNCYEVFFTIYETMYNVSHKEGVKWHEWCGWLMILHEQF